MVSPTFIAQTILQMVIQNLQFSPQYLIECNSQSHMQMQVVFKWCGSLRTRFLEIHLQVFCSFHDPNTTSKPCSEVLQQNKRNELGDLRQRHSVSDIRLVDHGINIAAHSHTELGKEKGITSSIISPILTKNGDIMHGLAQGMTNLSK